MKAFLQEAIRNVVALLVMFLLFAALISLAIAVFDNSQSLGLRIAYVAGGTVSIALSVMLPRWAKPRGTEGDLLYILLELLHLPK